MMYYISTLVNVLNTLMAANCPGSSTPIEAPCYYYEYTTGCGITCNGSTPMNVVKIFNDLNATLPADKKLFVRLYLINTAIEELPVGAFSGIQFKSIVMAGAQSLRVVNNNAFLGSENTATELVISHVPVNEVVSMGAHSQNLFGAIRTLRSLKSVAFYNTEIKMLPARGFEGLSQLTEITFNTNPIKSIQTYAFVNLPALRQLVIIDSAVERVSVRAFAGVTGADHLNLLLVHMITLTADDTLETGAFDAIGRPTELRLTDAGLKLLDRRVFKSFLADNPANTVRDPDFACADTRNKWVNDEYPNVWKDLSC